MGFIQDSIDGINGKKKLRNQYKASLEQANNDEITMLNTLQANFQKERNKIAADRNAARRFVGDVYTKHYADNKTSQELQSKTKRGIKRCYG